VNCRYKEVVPGHVGLWLLKRDNSIADWFGIWHCPHVST
jgi:hypothetical protein